MHHMASFGILLRKEDKDKKHENTECGYDESDLLPVHKAASEGDIIGLVNIIQEDPSLLEQHSADGEADSRARSAF
ncbi:hypothetical protein ElyMa_004623800 [Elysia marginata]|uniref:Uncharacterized protein n=1 Tax=Elysia marginata TaxID=1093978 RepID=A0AAV4HY12_9GAST|nr:hypothetical protein ElyMa_004623800 [Elysia marginata]